MRLRAVRGATTARANVPEDIYEATRELILEMARMNDIDPEDVVSVILTMTRDLDAAFPAKAVRAIPGWEMVPLLCASEIPVSGDVPRCIRVLIHCYTERKKEEVRHIYLGEAQRLRPDLTMGEERSRMQPSSGGS
ncbi:MAG: chorismate mutase [Alicyclobacillaceae bacterium]|nr:chorismate mutase [Alicyclobacillaceae bacterium]